MPKGQIGHISPTTGRAGVQSPAPTEAAPRPARFGLFKVTVTKPVFKLESLSAATPYVESASAAKKSAAPDLTRACKSLRRIWPRGAEKLSVETGRLVLNTALTIAQAHQYSPEAIEKIEEVFDDYILDNNWDNIEHASELLGKFLGIATQGQARLAIYPKLESLMDVKNQGLFGAFFEAVAVADEITPAQVQYWKMLAKETLAKSSEPAHLIGYLYAHLKDMRVDFDWKLMRGCPFNPDKPRITWDENRAAIEKLNELVAFLDAEVLNYQ